MIPRAAGRFAPFNERCGSGWRLGCGVCRMQARPARRLGQLADRQFLTLAEERERLRERGNVVLQEGVHDLWFEAA